jgi:vanillate O-demethylase ferredoxin subunit
VEQSGDCLSVRVSETRSEAEDIISYFLVSETGQPLPAFKPGAHVRVRLPSGLVRQYSLANDPEERERYLIAVKRESNGRGGSVEMHDSVSIGTHLSISAPVNNFALSSSAHRHMLVAGGIGITPIMSMVRFLHRQGASWTLHYCARSLSKMAFRDDLSQTALAEHVTFYYDDGDPTRGLSTAELLRAELAPATHVYCCGPAQLMRAVQIAGSDWPAGSLHFEYFTAASEPEQPLSRSQADGAFEVELASTGQVFVVGPDDTILSILEANGIDVPSLCTEGICGTCIVDVLSGEIDHRDHVLDAITRSANTRIAICCSRAKGARLKLAL